MGDLVELRVDRDGDAPIGAQLAEQIRTAVSHGRLKERDRLPSVRELAETAGVNVNTVRGVYTRLEAEGVVRSEHGRGTFVAGRRAERGTDAGLPTRGELRDQIAALEATLSRLPPPPLPVEPPQARSPGGASLLSTEELLAIRDRLVERLAQLDAERSALLESLQGLGLEAREPVPRRSSPSRAGARIRWVGA